MGRPEAMAFMGRYFRLWLLLTGSFGLVFLVFVNHDVVIIGYHGPGSTQVKMEARRCEIILTSTVTGTLLASVVTSVYWCIERAFVNREGSDADV